MFKHFPLGDSSFLIKLGDSISLEINTKLQILAKEIKKANIRGLIELVPAYNELLVHYNPLEISYTLLIDIFKLIENNLNPEQFTERVIHHIPVCYDIDFAPDIEYISKKTNLSRENIIQIHSTTKYLVYMLGFTPGFCYLGGMDERLKTKRKKTPNQRVQPGSVGIAGIQTGIYPIESPGAWQIIGRTPLEIFNPNRNPSFLISAGNYVKFDPISTKEYKQIKQKLENGDFCLKKEIANAFH